MDKKRFFRALVCFVLICSLIVNMSPLRAEAVAVVDDLTIGLIALLIAATAGVVFHPQTDDQIVAIGQSMLDSLNDWADTDEKADELTAWVDSCNKLYFGGPDYDPDDDNNPRNTQVKLARGILAGISIWLATLINLDRGIPVYYEDSTHLFTSVSFVYGSNNYICSSETPFVLFRYTYLDESGRGVTVMRVCTGAVAAKVSPSVYNTTKNSATGYYYLNILNTASTIGEFVDVTSDVYIPSVDLGVCSDPLSIIDPLMASYYDGTEIIYPSVYVGDIPQQVEDGELDDDKIPLPDVIDIDKLLQATGVSSAQEAVTQVMEQLASGQMSYNDYMDNVTVDTAGGDDLEDDNISGDDGSIQSYGLDLTDFFPFCIPFDIYDFFSILAADPVAPVFKWEISVPQLGQTFDVELDLSIWDSVAALFRKLELLGFILGLAYVTREKYLRG